MAGLAQDSKGNYRVRKRLPDDVREEYGRLYGPRYEAKFFAPKTVTKQEAIRRFGEWLAEIEARIATIRAERDGSGRILTREEARRLAGDWYEWFVALRAETSLEALEWRLDQVSEAFKSAGVSEREFELYDTDELWRMYPHV
jgi:hypothetical protein